MPDEPELWGVGLQESQGSREGATRTKAEVGMIQDPEQRNAGSLQETGKGRDRLSLEPPEGTSLHTPF